MKKIIIITLIFVVLPLTIKASEPSKKYTSGTEIVNDTMMCRRDLHLMKTYSCHASTAAALRDHINHWLDSAMVDVFDIQFMTEIRPYQSDTIFLSDSTLLGHIHTEIHPRPATITTYRAWIIYIKRERVPFTVINLRISDGDTLK